jgi:hypothetical protein
MSHRFVTLFTLRVSHDFYGGACRDFAFVLPRETARRMAGVKLVSRVLDGVLHVLFAAGEDGAPVVSAAGRTVRIGLKPLHPDFSNFTAIGFNPAAAVAVYQNETAAEELDDPVLAAPAGPLLVHPLADAERPVTVTVKGADGETLRSETVEAAERSTVSFDLTGEAPGLCRVEEEYPANLTSTDYYLDPELRREGVLAIVEIGIDGAFHDAAPAFEIAFDARRETLKYYLVVRNYTSAELDQLNVSDAGFGEDGRPEVTFTRVAAAAFTQHEIPASLLAGGGGDVVLFKSQAPVARQAKGRRKIQLTRNGELLIEHLPQVGAGKPDANLIVHVSKP